MNERSIVDLILIKSQIDVYATQFSFISEHIVVSIFYAQYLTLR